MKTVLCAALLCVPWRLRRLLLRWLFGYEIDRTARIGFSWIYPTRLEMQPGARIGSFSACRGLELMRLGKYASIGRLNWISGWPSDDRSHYADDRNREPRLILGNHSAITHRHLVDCTALVQIGDYTTVAGYRSQILTHSIDLAAVRQAAADVRIGHHCFVGTGCTLLPGSRLPDNSVLAARAVLVNAISQPYGLFAGIPAARVKDLDPGLGYFHRERGFVV